MLYRLLRFVPAVLWMAVIYRASATPGLKGVPLVQRFGLLPADLSPAVEKWLELLLRKSVHVVSYGILAMLLVWALRGLAERGRALRWALIVAVLYAISDEFHQSLVPDRTGRWYDVLIDTVGVALGLLVPQVRGRRQAGVG